MLTSTTATMPASSSPAPVSSATAVSAIAVAIDHARTRLDAALADLRMLLAAGDLAPDEAHGLQDEYAEVYLGRVAALEQLGELACTPAEWRRYTKAAEMRTCAKARRERLRDAITARQCLVVAPGRIADPFLAALVDAEPDAEVLEIRAELAARGLL